MSTEKKIQEARTEFIEKCKEAFLEWIDKAECHVFLKGIVYDEGRAFEVTTEHSDLWICGVLWDCGQKLPDVFCEKLGVPIGATYKAVARKIRPDAAVFWKSQPDFVALDEPLRDPENWLKV